MTARLFTLHPVEGFRPKTFAGHRDIVVRAYFSEDSETIYTISRDGAVFVWSAKTAANGGDDDDDEAEEDDEPEMAILDAPASSSSTAAADNVVAYTRWGIVGRHYFNQPGTKVVCTTFHPQSSLLVVGFSTGVFGLWEMPTFTNVHTLSISQEKISSVAINKTGEWLVFGATKLGQLLVWEWQSESYILKQQGHYYDMNTLSFSQDGQNIATGGDDGKVKVWNTNSGFCYVTFTDHSSSVSCVEFAKQGQVLFTASLDGTVRAYDLVRYRNFRTFTSPTPVQFSSLAVDPSGDVVCAGSLDSFEIYMWSVQTGKLLDILTGHTAPVSALQFSPTGNQLASASWDRSVRLWAVFGRSKLSEPFELGSDVLALAFRPDGRELAASTLDGQIVFWDVEDSKQTGVIEGRKDISGGRKQDDRTTAQNSASGKSFNSLAYTADGSCVIAGGSSKYVVIYDVKDGVMVKKYQISQNLSLDGTQEMLDSRKILDGGMSVDAMDLRGDESDLEDRLDKTLPGASRGDLSKRRYKQEARTKAVRFSPTGRSWAAASTEGLLIYSLDDLLSFDPFDLAIDITPQSLLATLADREYLLALIISFRLNEKPLILKAYESIPPTDIRLLAQQLPKVYVPKLLRFIAGHVEASPHVEFDLLWVGAILRAHGRWLRERSGEFASEFRAIQKGVADFSQSIARLCDDNAFSLSYIIDQQAAVEAKAGADAMLLDVGDDAGLEEL